MDPDKVYDETVYVTTIKTGPAYPDPMELILLVAKGGQKSPLSFEEMENIV